MKLPKGSKWFLGVGAVIVFFILNPKGMSIDTTQDVVVRIGLGLAALIAIQYFGQKTTIPVLVVIGLFMLFMKNKEGLEVEGKAIEGTQCPEKFNFDVAVQMCKDDKGALVKPIQVKCASGYTPNATNDKCIQVVPPDSPNPPPPGPPPGVEPPAPPAETSASTTGSATAESAAPATGTEKFEGRGTIATTPGEAQDKAKSTVVLQQQTPLEPFRNWGGVGFPLQ